jgi:hypothetical protein
MPPGSWKRSLSAVVMAVTTPMMVTEAPRLSFMYLGQKGFQPCCIRLHREVVRDIARMFLLLNTSRIMLTYSLAPNFSPA